MDAFPSSPQDLEPWIIVSAGEQVAVWRIDATGQDSLALFSDPSQAETYAERHCSSPWQVVQCSDQHLIRLMADGFRQGMLYAALDPGETTARQMFVLRDVLKAAKAKLERQRSHP